MKRALRRLGYTLVRIDPAMPKTASHVAPSPPTPSRSPVGAFIPSVPVINIVDVGAMFAGDGVEPYSALRDAGLARVVGFEPVAEECAKLNQRFVSPIATCRTPSATELHAGSMSAMRA